MPGCGMTLRASWSKVTGAVAIHHGDIVERITGEYILFCNVLLRTGHFDQSQASNGVEQMLGQVCVG